jgi:hypothetical protein
MIEHEDSQRVDVDINYPGIEIVLPISFYILLNNDVKIQDIIDTSMLDIMKLYMQFRLNWAVLFLIRRS